MFTGLIHRTGTLLSTERRDFGALFAVDVGDWEHRPAPGDSIAVDGCCLTVAEAAGPRLRFDVIRQTLEVTTLARMAPGRRVNLEHAATPSTLLGGHIVQGHIDGVGRIARVDADESAWRVRIEVPPALRPLMIDKGSVAIDGVSLTIAAVAPGRDWIEVALIPTTLQITNLGERVAGDPVNLESDCIVRAVAHLMAAGAATAAPQATRAVIDVERAPRGSFGGRDL